MSVANQKIVRISKRMPRDREHLYATMNLDALQFAMQELKGSSFKLWAYFNKNQDNYQFELSQKACEEWGIKKDSYYSAVDELINKGFLVQDHYGSNMYWFHEKAVSEKPKCFSEIPIEASENQKEESEKPERNNTNNTEIIKNTTLTDDNAVGVIVDCGIAAIQSEESQEEKMQRWFGTYKHETVCESPTALLDKYF